MSAPPNPRDPFREARETDGILRCPFQGESIPMILRHADLRAAARDWQTYSSDAPFRVPIPSEEEVRSIRQVPLEADPPEHTAYRKIIEPFFLRSKSPEVVAKVEALISEFLTAALSRDSIEAVYDFALPIQSRALTYLLNVPESEADTYIGWGIHVFTDAESHSKDGPTLEDYHHSMFDRAAANPGSDFFSALTQATYRGRPLSREEMMGFANLTFAGGRDTIIHSITTTLAHLAQHPADLAFLREDPKRITLASEEFFRAYMPLTHLGRVCPVETKVTAPPSPRRAASPSAGLPPISTPPSSTTPTRSASTANPTPTSPSASAPTSASAPPTPASSSAPSSKPSPITSPPSTSSTPRNTSNTPPPTSAPTATTPSPSPSSAADPCYLPRRRRRPRLPNVALDSILRMAPGSPSRPPVAPRQYTFPTGTNDAHVVRPTPVPIFPLPQRGISSQPGTPSRVHPPKVSCPTGTPHAEHPTLPPSPKSPRLSSRQSHPHAPILPPMLPARHRQTHAPRTRPFSSRRRSSVLSYYG